MYEPFSLGEKLSFYLAFSSLVKCRSHSNVFGIVVAFVVVV
jgi:hypothetical protein